MQGPAKAKYSYTVSICHYYLPLPPTKCLINLVPYVEEHCTDNRIVQLLTEGFALVSICFAFSQAVYKITLTTGVPLEVFCYCFVRSMMSVSQICRRIMFEPTALLVVAAS
jgi:hypothetical protein